MRRVILLAWLLGCGGGDGAGSATTGGAGDASAQAGATGTGAATGGSGPGTGGAPATGGAGGTGAAGMSGSGDAPGTGGSGTGGALAAGGSGGAPSPDAGGVPLSCPQAQAFQATLCGYPGPQLVTWVGRWKEGLECATCTSIVGQHVGCTADKGGRTTEGPGPLLCVAGCGECCLRQADSPCSGDADCCAPLHCMAGDAGGRACH